MPTIEEYATQPREQRMQRLTRTADELAAVIKGQSDAVLARRPDAKSWAAKEVVCHVRDTEEVFGARIEQILAMDVDPKLVVTNPDRWAEERQYLTSDVGKLASAQWEKGGTHPVNGRITLDGFLSVLAWHDDNHLDQLTRALQGRA